MITESQDPNISIEQSRPITAYGRTEENQQMMFYRTAKNAKSDVKIGRVISPIPQRSQMFESKSDNKISKSGNTTKRTTAYSQTDGFKHVRGQ